MWKPYLTSPVHNLTWCNKELQPCQLRNHSVCTEMSLSPCAGSNCTATDHLWFQFLQAEEVSATAPAWNVTFQLSHSSQYTLTFVQCNIKESIIPNTHIFSSIDSMPHGCQGQEIMLIKAIIQGKAAGGCHDREPWILLLSLSCKYGYCNACPFLPSPLVLALVLFWCKYMQKSEEITMYMNISCHTQASLSPMSLLLIETLLSSAYFSFHSLALRISFPLPLWLQQLEPLEKWHQERITVLVGWGRKEEAAVPQDRPIQVSHCSTSVHSLIWPHLPPPHTVSYQHQD